MLELIHNTYGMYSHICLFESPNDSLVLGYWSISLIVTEDVNTLYIKTIQYTK